jgi:hypothetical protein
MTRQVQIDSQPGGIGGQIGGVVKEQGEARWQGWKQRLEDRRVQEGLVRAVNAYEVKLIDANRDGNALIAQQPDRQAMIEGIDFVFQVNGRAAGDGIRAERSLPFCQDLPRGMVGCRVVQVGQVENVPAEEDQVGFEGCDRLDQLSFAPSDAFHVQVAQVEYLQACSGFELVRDQALASYAECVRLNPETVHDQQRADDLSSQGPLER